MRFNYIAQKTKQHMCKVCLLSFLLMLVTLLQPQPTFFHFSSAMNIEQNITALSARRAQTVKVQCFLITDYIDYEDDITEHKPEWLHEPC
jgi:hypothetical protein